MDKKMKREPEAEAAVDNFMFVLRLRAAQGGISLDSEFARSLLSNARASLLGQIKEYYELYDC